MEGYFLTPLVVAGEEIKEGGSLQMDILGVRVPNDPLLINIPCKFLS